MSKRAAEGEPEVPASPPKRARVEDALPPTRPIKSVLIEVDGTVSVIEPLATLDDPEDPAEPYCIQDALDPWLGKDYDLAPPTGDTFYLPYWVWIGDQQDADLRTSARHNYLKNGVAMGVLDHLGGMTEMPRFAWEGKAILMGSCCRSLTDEEIAKIKAEALVRQKSREKCIDSGEWDVAGSSSSSAGASSSDESSSSSSPSSSSDE